ncbi:hypothetical protein F2Q68_00006696 [Brassica cretica]|uniref:Dolichyl-diphosphooligosaccharide-protein glycosyltransferase subunit OST5 n=1 Tax=Brassica cretica TaxID=69181 RepID=A0A8S9JJJ5_BRACR|nr:hypothetical protein F2Q68_00006696 [Brassica cretica]
MVNQYPSIPGILIGSFSYSFCFHVLSGEETAKPIGSPIPVAIYPTLSVFTLAIGLVITAFFFIYEATSSRKNRSLGMELASATVASVFLGFGSLFLLLASGVYV